MSTPTAPRIRIGIYGQDNTSPDERHGCKLWPAGVAASLEQAEADSVWLPGVQEGSWEDVLEGLHGVVLIGHDRDSKRLGAEAEQLCVACHEHKVPLLAIDHGLLMLNSAHGGTNYFDLPREMSDALQHRHPPERGLRHALNVLPKTHLADLYGEGEVVVNSEHRRAVQRVARGFRVCAQALDGIVEAIEAEDEGWFALGVQWQPASATASGLDIQLFRGLVRACQRDVLLPDLATTCSAA
jgi:putative glutamine amidotransferase